eukprot:gene6414-8831_t
MNQKSSIFNNFIKAKLFVNNSNDALKIFKSCLQVVDGIELLKDENGVGRKCYRTSLNILEYANLEHLNVLMDFFERLGSPEFSKGQLKILSGELYVVAYRFPGFMERLTENLSKIRPKDFATVGWFILSICSDSAEIRSDQKVLDLVSRGIFDSTEHGRPLRSLLYTNINRVEVVSMYENGNSGEDNKISSLQELRDVIPAHDNDFPNDFREIKIAPTVDELNCGTNKFRNWSLTNQDPQMLDRQFRLLREDMIIPMKTQLKEIVTSTQASNQNNKNVHLRFFKPYAIRFEEKPTPCMMIRFDMPKNIQGRLNNLNAPAKQDLLENNLRKLLARDSLLIFMKDNKVCNVGVVVRRDPIDLSKDSLIGVSFHPGNYGDILKHLCLDIESIQIYKKMPVADFFFQASTSYFSYQPLLKRLKHLMQYPFPEELVNKEVVVKEEALPNQVASILSTDQSQLVAGTMAMNNRVSLIQGPPGTALSILQNNPFERILVLCFTNHALDSFIESLVAAGLDINDVVRLGNLNKVSEKLKSRSLNQMNGEKFNRNQNALFGSYKRTQEECKNNIEMESNRIGKMPPLNHNRWRMVAKHFEDNCNELILQFTMFGIDADKMWTKWYKGGTLSATESAAFYPIFDHHTVNLWKLSIVDRMKQVQEWHKEILEPVVEDIESSIAQYEKASIGLSQLKHESKLVELRRAKVVACITTSAAKQFELMECLAPSVVLVEEAAEILESHVITNIHTSTRKLIMIGDHLQLRPKLECYDLRKESGHKIDFDVSLFERLATNGYPIAVLSVQHRMRPEISTIVRSLTYPELVDHPSVLNRENIRGVQSNVVFINHNKLETSADEKDVLESNSKTNIHESKMIVEMIRYFMNQGYEADDMVVLTPYLGQLMLIRNVIKEKLDLVASLGELDRQDVKKMNNNNIESNDDSDEFEPAGIKSNKQVRVATIDNYQGEESKIVLCSLVRSNPEGDIGFMSGAERVNVLCSRARDGFFMIGNLQTFYNAKSRKGQTLWQKLFSVLNSQIYEGFPIICERHKVCQLVDTPEAFQALAPDGGCNQPCNMALESCQKGHMCPLKCHPLALNIHRKLQCKVQMPSKCVRGQHDVKRLCSSSVPTKCEAKISTKCEDGIHELFHKCFDEKPVICKKCETIKDKIKSLEEARIRDLEKSENVDNELEYKLIEAQDELKRITAEAEKSAASNRRAKELRAIQSKADQLKSEIQLRVDNESSKLSNSTSSKKALDKSNNLRKKVEKNSPKSVDKNPSCDDTKGSKEIIMDIVNASSELTIQDNIEINEMDEMFIDDSNLEKIAAKMPEVDQKPIPTVQPKAKDSTQNKEIIRNAGNNSSKAVPVVQQQAKYKLKEVEEKEINSKISVARLMRSAKNNNWLEVFSMLKSPYPDNSSLVDIANDLPTSSGIMFTIAILKLEDDTCLEDLYAFLERNQNEINSDRVFEVGLLHYALACMTNNLGDSPTLTCQYAQDFIDTNNEDGIFPSIWVDEMKEMIEKYQFQMDEINLTLTVKKLSVKERWKVCKAEFKRNNPDKMGDSPSAAFDTLIEMTGLEKVKSSFLSDYYKINLAKRQQVPCGSSFNTRFDGNPGTGKTTVARLYGQFLIDVEILPKKATVIETTGSSLKTNGVKGLKDLLEGLASNGGGVIFIDEAYQLDDFEGHKILDFILVHTEQLKGEYGSLVWILAGYAKKMDKLFEQNPGLPSRFPHKFIFEDYTDEELLSIFNGLLESGGPTTNKSNSNNENKTTIKPPTVINMPNNNNPYNYNSYPYGIRAVTSPQIDAWGNQWVWDPNNFTWEDIYDNITGYGVTNLGTAHNPLVSRTDNSQWTYDTNRNLWRSNTGKEQSRYPGKPEEKIQLMKKSGKSKFRVIDPKWSRVAIRRLGKLRGKIGFGNARAVRILFDASMKRQAVRISDLETAGFRPDIYELVRDDLLGPLASEDVLKKCEAWKELQRMEGLAEVKNSVAELLNLVIRNAEREDDEKPMLDVSLNRLFLGSPGTGKTTVAKLYGSILRDFGLLSKGEVILKNPSDFVGDVLGSSEKQTRSILESSVGCVLVIDEAYGLDPNNGIGSSATKDPYKEAVINTLVEQVQGVPGDDRAVVMLGYKQEMESMMKNCNPGLARRFQLENAFIFHDYNDDALTRILRNSVRKFQLKIDLETTQYAIEQLAKAKAKPNFGNAGAVNNLLSDAKLKYLTRQSKLPFENRSEWFIKSDFGELINYDIDALFDELVGCDDIKNKMQEYRRTIEHARHQGNSLEEFAEFNYVFSGSPGTGKTTVARLMGKIFSTLRLIPSDELVEISASDLVTGYVGQTGTKTREIMMSSKGKVLFIDEAYQLNPKKGGQYMQEAVDEMVKLLTSEDLKGKLIVILAGYREDMDQMLDVNQGLRSRFTERFDFVDLSEELIEDLLKKKLNSLNLTWSEEANNDIPRIVKRLKGYPSFANGRDVETLCRKALKKLAVRLTTSTVIETCDLDEALEELAKTKFGNSTQSSNLPSADNIESLFDELVGCKNIRDKLSELKNTIELAKSQNKDPRDKIEMNFVFTGSPGTGKTDVVEISASDLVTGYVGQTGTKTREIMMSSKGKVLFIDEAYQLNPKKGGQYMQEAVDEMVKLLTSEDLKGKLIVILAGYREDMDQMLDVNQGLRSRFSERIHFDDLSLELIVNMLSSKLNAQDLVLSKQSFDYLPIIAEKILQLPFFANGRDVDTLAKKTYRAFASRLNLQQGGTSPSPLLIESEDLDNALNELKKSKDQTFNNKETQQEHTVSRPAYKLRSTTVKALEEESVKNVEIKNDSVIDPPPKKMCDKRSVTAEDDDYEIVDDFNADSAKETKNNEEKPTNHFSSMNMTFLKVLQDIMDEKGYNTEEGVQSLIDLQEGSTGLRDIITIISNNLNIAYNDALKMFRDWKSNYKNVQKELKKQKQEMDQAKKQKRKALLPIWRCATIMTFPLNFNKIGAPVLHELSSQTIMGSLRTEKQTGIGTGFETEFVTNPVPFLFFCS